VSTGTPASDTWTIKRLLDWTRVHFEKADIDAPRLTAEKLLGHVLNVKRVNLYMDLDRPLSKEELATYKALIQRRLKFEPTQYLVQRAEFFGRAFYVDERVLIPRPETELLVEAALEVIPEDIPKRILELCTGTGCIALSIALERPKTSIWATDVSKEALDVASKNAEILQSDSRVAFFRGDLFLAIDQQATFDVIVSNPPYIKSGDLSGLQAEVKKEPTLALDGGASGLVLLAKIVAQGLKFLKPGGRLALEHGDEQGDAVKEFMVRAGYLNVETRKDLARLPRLTLGNAASSGIKELPEKES
jgi:release factor glutamine methyltransferase